MSRLKDKRFRHDHHYNKAKEQGYAARSIFKLEEIDKRFHLVRPNFNILDLGCRPGSWMQYCAQKVGPQGFVVGIDRSALDIPTPKNATIFEGDVFQTDPQLFITALPETVRGKFHLVLSDMAPDTSGIPFTDQVRSVELFLRALDIAIVTSEPGGAFVGKIFMGEGFTDALATVRKHYALVKVVRPEATRKISVENFIVGQQLRSTTEKPAIP